VTRTIAVFAILVALVNAGGAAQTKTRTRPVGPLRAFVTNERSGTVSVIDVESDRVIATVPLGGRARGIQARAGSADVLVALSDRSEHDQSKQDAIAVIDATRNSVVRKYDGGSDPEQFAIAADGRRLYVSNEDAGTATAFDLAAHRPLVSLQVGIEPEGVAISPDGRWFTSPPRRATPCR
jgi:YVTN family beta-propeller protein